MSTRVFHSTTCPTCTRGPATPYRQYNMNGTVTAGCVDAFHTDHLATPSASASWHGRPAATRIRAALRAGRHNSITVYAQE